jgi:hypothetical protein
LPSGGGARSEGTLAATGSTQGDAAQITTEAVEVTGADGTKGVRLPDTEAGMVVVYNAAAGSILKVWPPVGARFGTNATNANTTIGPEGSVLYCRTKATQWSSH